jgi:hypothetical protein
LQYRNSKIKLAEQNLVLTQILPNAIKIGCVVLEKDSVAIMGSLYVLRAENAQKYGKN